MSIASSLLAVIGLLGAFDIAYFHTYKAQLVLHACSRREAFIHVVRGFVYATQFLVVPNLRFNGAWYLAYAALFALDIAVAVCDVLEEPRSRAEQGGLVKHEYLIHIVLSVLVGALLYSLCAHTGAWYSEPTALVFEPHGPVWLRSLLALMAVGALLVAWVEALVLIEPTLGAPRPLHVRVQLAASLAQVWNVTQDHRLHPRWDYRFSRIIMEHEDGQTCEPGAQQLQPSPLGIPDARIGSGTRMRYERDLFGLTIRGFGRYKLHRPLRQSTFEFGSDDPRSLIRRGVGLWLYTDLGDGNVELSTSFTYDVRWGMIGRVIDRYLFRPLFQRLTEGSFRRLSRLCFGAPSARVLGRRANRPLRFAKAGS